MDGWAAVIGVGIAVNTLLNGLYLFVLADIRSRVARLENLAMKKTP
jgi:5-carboxymethyl-2-hydroxymuconate isomerase